MAIRATLHGSVSTSITTPTTISIAASNSLYPARADYRCDGVADEVQVNAAIAALPTGGGKISFLDGTFKFAAKVVITKSNVLFEGMGKATIIATDGLADDFFQFTTKNYIRFQDFSILGTNQTAGNGINAIGTCVGCSTSNVVISGCFGSIVLGAVAGPGFNTILYSTDYNKSTSTTAGIQEAITALPVGGGTVIIPVGTHTVSSTILVPSNTEINVVGGATVKVASGLNIDFVIFTNSVKLTGNTNISITGGGTLNCNVSGNTAGRQTAIQFWKVTGVKLDVNFSDYVGIPYDLNQCYKVNTDRTLKIETQRELGWDFEADVVKTVDSGSNPLANINGSWGMVFLDGATYHFYYYNTTTGNIDHATSANGVAWTDDAAHNPMINRAGQAWHANLVWCPNVWKEGATWYMLYTGRIVASGGIAKMGLATAAAPEGPWTDYAGNPVYDNVNTDWGPGAECDGIYKVGSVYHIWINNFGSGKARMTGKVTSTDLITWTPDPHNPIFTDSRFCPWTFVFGAPAGQIYYTMVVRRYESSGNDSVFELYSDTHPTFYPSERQNLGVFQNTKRDATTWNGKDLDTPTILSTSVTQYQGSTPGVLKMYYAGAPQTGSWRQGLADIDTSVFYRTDLLMDCYDTTNIPATGWTLSVANPKTGVKSLAIDTSVGHEFYRFHFTGEKRKVSFWIYKTETDDVLNINLNNNAVPLCSMQYFQGKLQLKNGSTLIDTGIALPKNYWYQFEIRYDSSLGRWNLTIKNTSGVSIFTMSNLAFDASVTTETEVTNLSFFKYSSQIGIFYIDDLVIGE